MITSAGRDVECFPCSLPRLQAFVSKAITGALAKSGVQGEGRGDICASCTVNGRHRREQQTAS